MPEFSAADVRLWDRLAEKRDRKGAEWCKKNGFGAERRSLERAAPFDVVAINARDETDRAMAATRERHRMQLASICKKCGRCELAG